MSFRHFIYLILMSFLVYACTAPPPASSPPLDGLTLLPDQASKEDPLYMSSGGGEPRSPGYWLIWNSCVEGNQAETARANGGRAAGWIVMDDLLADPGMLVGELQVETCEQGENLLQARSLNGIEMKLDAAYTLAAQLLAAQLNLATGSEYCPASDQAVSQAQLLLLQLGFDGTTGYLGPPLASSDIDEAKMLTEQLTLYNSGALCQ